jgi:hypothetical protein
VLGGYRSYQQSVYQFGSQRAATALSAQTYAKYTSCRSFAFSGVRIKLESEAKTRVGVYRAFLVKLVVSYPGSTDAPRPYPEEVLFTTDGDDAFLMNVGTSMTTSPPNTSLVALTLHLIVRVQALR